MYGPQIPNIHILIVRVMFVKMYRTRDARPISQCNETLDTSAMCVKCIELEALVTLVSAIEIPWIQVVN